MLRLFFCNSCPMMVTPIIVGFTGRLGGTAFLMGLIGGLMNISSLLFRPFAGNFADRFKKYNFVLFGLGCMLTACIGYCVAANTVALVIARALNGIGFATCTISLSTWISMLLPGDKVGSGVGIYGIMQALGMAISPSIGIEIKNAFGYRAAFAAAGLFALVSIVIVLFVKDKGVPAVSSKQTPFKLRVLEKKVIPIALIIAFFTIPYAATQSFLVSYVERRQFAVTVSLFFPLYAVALVVLRVGGRKYFDRIQFKYFLFISLVSMMLCLLSLEFINGNLIMLCSAIFMAGGYGIMCSVSQTAAIKLAGAGQRGLANSTYYLGLDSGMALGPLIGGMLYGNVDISLFYICLLASIPLCFFVYCVYRMKLGDV